MAAWDAGFYSEGLMGRFASEAKGRMQEFSQQNLANMAWAFGKLTHHAPSLLDAIGHKATAVVQVATRGHGAPLLVKPDMSIGLQAWASGWMSGWVGAQHHTMRQSQEVHRG